MKKVLRFLSIIIFCSTITSSSQAYTRGDLEILRRNSAIAELALSVPFLFKSNIPFLFLSAPAGIIERFTSLALEKDSHLISELSGFLKNLKIGIQNETHFHLYILDLLKKNIFRITNKIIMVLHPNPSNRVLRRTIRTVTNSFIGAFFPSIGDYMSNYYREYQSSASLAATFLGKLLGSLIIRGILEYAGEQIIQGTE